MIEVQSIISPREPIDKRGWRKLPSPPSWVSLGYAAVAFENDSHQVTVISAVEVADGLTEDKKVPQYHLSISSYDGRAPLHLAMWVLGQFDLIDVEEDNHVPGGMSRHFWRPVADKLSGIDSEKVKEIKTWSQFSGNRDYSIIESGENNDANNH